MDKPDQGGRQKYTKTNQRHRLARAVHEAKQSSSEEEVIMSAVAAKRGRRKMLKPKVSFGSSSGSSPKLPRVPEENGPSLEPRWVLAEYDMFTFFLDPDARFTQLHERLHSFIYHEDPDYECDCYSHSCPTVPLADLCDGLCTTALGAKMAVIACDETGEPADGAGGSVSMQKNKANAARYCYMSPCRYLPEVDTDDTVKIWCSRSQPSQVTQCGSRAWMVEVEQERSSSSGSEYDQLDEEVQDEEGSRESRDDENDGLPVNRACYSDHTNAIGEMLVCRVLRYIGLLHLRVSSSAASAAWHSPNLTTVLQATTAPLLQDLPLELPSQI
ncbi:hypothetical protein HPB50_027869 [Hyalomma asiaticum]|nr:hypothetical protein HPB50_027869 [Hyalomma asiaticum]